MKNAQSWIHSLPNLPINIFHNTVPNLQTKAAKPPKRKKENTPTHTHTQLFTFHTICSTAPRTWIPRSAGLQTFKLRKKYQWSAQYQAALHAHTNLGKKILKLFCNRAPIYMKNETLFGFKHLSTQKSLSLISGTLTPNCYTTKSSSPTSSSRIYLHLSLVSHNIQDWRFYEPHSSNFEV
jgi:hypothetical protein